MSDMNTGAAAPQDERAAFEAFANADTSGVKFERDEDGDYIDMSAALLWHGWQLRAALPAQAVAPAAWAGVDEKGNVECLGMNQSRRFDTPLYTHPAPARCSPAVGNAPTDEQIDAILDERGTMEYVIADKRQRMHLFARRVLELAAPVQDVAPIQARAFGIGDAVTCDFIPDVTLTVESEGDDAVGCTWGDGDSFERAVLLKSSVRHAAPPAVAQDVAPSEARKGWRLVPTEPSKDQLAKAQKHWAYSQSWETATDCYRALVAAAPAAPQAVPRELPDAERRELIGNYFAEDWAKDAADGLLHDYARAIAVQPAAQPADAQDYKQAQFEAWYLDSNDVPKEAVSRAEPGQCRGMYAWIGTDEAWDIWTAAIDAARTQEGAAS